MTEQEAIERLRAIHAVRSDDPEALHVDEDDLLLGIVAAFGWADFVAAYNVADVTRWYS